MALYYLAIEYIPRLMSYMPHIKTNKPGNNTLLFPPFPLPLFYLLIFPVFIPHYTYSHAPLRSQTVCIKSTYYTASNYSVQQNVCVSKYVPFPISITSSTESSPLSLSLYSTEMGVLLLDILCYLLAVEKGSPYPFLLTFSSSLLHLSCPEWPQASQEILSRLCHFILPTCLQASSCKPPPPHIYPLLDYYCTKSLTPLFRGDSEIWAR